MYKDLRVALIVPALDEGETIGTLVSAVDKKVVDQIVVVDNGSKDTTARKAEDAGARVVREERKGYGSACLTGIAVASDADLLVFMDGDGSDDPAEIPHLLEVLEKQAADLVVGSRVLGEREPGALTAVQRFGNTLTCRLIRLFWRKTWTDLGPFRVIRSEALKQLEMKDPDFGWIIEMQVKAAQRDLHVVEIPVRSLRRRGGQSKVSGTLSGSWNAGRRILGYVFGAKAAELFRNIPHPFKSPTSKNK